MLVYGPNHCTVLTLKGNSTYCGVRSWTLTITVLPNEPLGPRDMKQDRDPFRPAPQCQQPGRARRTRQRKTASKNRDSKTRYQTERTRPRDQTTASSATPQAETVRERDSTTRPQTGMAARESQRETASTRTQRAR